MNDLQYKKTTTLLKVTNVSLNLGGKQILKDVNFEVKDIEVPGTVKGQIISLIAKSGRGKTQLFKIMGGIQKPNSGSVQIMGKELRNVEIGDVGIVQQDYPLFDQMTVEDNLKVAAHFLPKGERKDKVESFLEGFDLLDKRKLYPIQLSGGQRQRTAIAQQMICTRHFLLMDEPFSGQDLGAIEAVSSMIINVANLHELNTIFIVSHDISSACAVSDTVLLLGLDKDRNGKYIPGAKIQKEYDLIERNLAWHTDLRNNPEFGRFTNEVKNEFLKY